MTNDNFNNTVLGTDGARYVQILDAVSAELVGRQYEFMGENEFHDLLRRDRLDGMRVYWKEMLLRAHWSSSVAMIRTKRWLEAMKLCYDTPNILGFAAATRGLLESAADSADSLMTVPVTLAELRATIQAALKRQLRIAVVSKELEDGLIHFTHARRIKEGEAPQSHQAKTNKKYLQHLDHDGRGRFAEMYAWLCEVTHPAAASVTMFSDLLEQRDDVVKVVMHNDGPFICAYAAAHRDMFLELMYFGVNPALMTLKVINRFDMESLRTPYMNKVRFEAMSGWAKVNEAWSSSTVPDGSAA